MIGTVKSIAKGIGLATLCAMVLLAPAAHAQKQPSKPVSAPVSGPAGIGKGDVEFSVFGNYTTYDDVDSDTLLLGVAVGSFLADSFELRVAPIIVWSDFGTTSLVSFAPFISGEFLFRGASRANPVVPFVGGGIGINLTFITVPGPDIFQYGLTVGPTGGVKYFLTERASLELALTYHLGLIEACTSTDCLSGDTDTLQQTLRFNFYY